MKRFWISSVSAVAAVVLAAGAVAAEAQRHHGRHAPRTTQVYTLDGDHGNPEGVAFDKRSGNFFVSSAADGSIWRGRLGDTGTPVPVFVTGGTGNAATGMKVSKGKLYVAGASTGTIKVYDIATGALLATFDTKGGSSSPTFVNDLVITRDGDVFATDSFRPALYHLSAAEVAAGTPTPKPIDPADVITTTPDMPFDATAGTFNLNGIVELGSAHHRHLLVVVDTNSGRLFLVQVRDGKNSSRKVAELVVSGGPFKGGDGLLLDGGRLIVVQGSNTAVPGGANGLVDFIQLRVRHHVLSGRLRRQRTDATLRGPSTIARADGRYLVVNADFAQNRKPFTVSGLPR